MSGIEPRRDDEYLSRKLRDMEQRIGRLEKARRLESATIGAGGLTIKDDGSLTIEDGGGVIVQDGGGLRLIAPDGTTIFWVVSNEGTPDPDGNPQPSVFMFREDGTVAMSLDDPLPNVDGYRQIFRLFDRASNEIFAEDATSGTGIANPWIPFSMFPSRYTDWPKSTSGTFETVWRGAVNFKNPTVVLGAGYTSDEPATTGEVRFRINETVVGTTQSFGFAIASTLLANQAPLPAGVGINDFVMVELQLRRTAGVGNVMSAPYVVTGSQSL